MSDERKFYKNEPGDAILWVDDDEAKGEFLFSFDGEKIYNLFADYPQNMTEKEVEIFDRENPEWADFFKERKR